MKYEIRQLDCYLYGDEWTQNTSYLIGAFETHCKAENDKRAFTRYLANKHGIVFKKNRTRIEFDGVVIPSLTEKQKNPCLLQFLSIGLHKRKLKRDNRLYYV